MNELFSIAGKVAVITGAGGVLGGNIAQHFVQQGHPTFQKRNKQHTIAIHQPKENRKSTAYIDNRQYAGKEHILSAGL